MKQAVLIFSVLIIVLSGISKPSYAQIPYTLTFCTGVDAKGNPANPGSTFYISKENGGYIYFLVWFTEKLYSCLELHYRIYQEKNGSYEWVSTIEQDQIKEGWEWVWRKVNFYTEGKYRVDVVGCNEQFILTNYVTIKYKGNKNHKRIFHRDIQNNR